MAQEPSIAVGRGGLDAFWRKLRVRRNEADCGGDDIFGNGICDNASFVADGELARIRRRQVDRHVNIVQIKDRQYALAGGDHFAGAGESVLHASASRRDEHQIDQNRFESLDVGLGRFDRELGLIALVDRRTVSGLGVFKLVAPLVDSLLADVPPLPEGSSRVPSRFS
jgi:hypothetical protein